MIYNMNKERYKPDNYKKTNTKTRPKKIGQVFFFEKGNKPLIVNAKITMAHGFSASGTPRTQTKWHYTYLKHNDWNAFHGGYIGKTLDRTDIVEAEYIEPGETE